MRVGTGQGQGQQAGLPQRSGSNRPSKAEIHSLASFFSCYSRIQIRALAAAHKLSPTDADTIKLSLKRQALLKRINAWYRVGGNLFPDLDLHEMGETGSGTTEPCVCEETVSCYCPHRTNGKPITVDFQLAESMTLPLPSSVQTRPEIWDILVTREEKLRVAQANEALQDLRIEIAKKSAMYRSNDELALGKRERLRNFDAINTVERTMRELVKCYEEANWALRGLGVKNKYPYFKVIQRSDLKAVTSVYAPNAPGQRNEGLSWIWTTALGHANGPGNAQHKDYMSECTRLPTSIPNGLLIPFFAVYRVNWIRGRSRLDRWTEEVEMLKAEMGWFVRYCNTRAGKALSWVKDGASEGNQAYCFRQEGMWERMASRASVAFTKAGVTI